MICVECLRNWLLLKFIVLLPLKIWVGIGSLFCIYEDEDIILELNALFKSLPLTLCVTIYNNSLTLVFNSVMANGHTPKNYTWLEQKHVIPK
jgi:hypothetical protein